MPETSTAASVRVEHDGPVAVLRLDRPEGRNSFDVATLDLLLARVRDLTAHPAVRAVVLTGAGRVFCAGADVTQMRASDDPARLFDELTLRYHAVLQTMRGADQVFVAAVNGVAAGGGVGLALSCDLLVAARSARFVLAYANLGISPDGGVASHLVRTLGQHRARELILLDEGLDAEKAHAWGLVNRVVDDHEVLDAATAVAARVAARAAHTVRETKRLVHLAAHADTDAVLEAERRAIIGAGRTEDFAEGLTAFFEKRPPRFA